ncbi:hypothetical protein NC652_017366 [Populus alba x Populus x berolinensis]|nr:hypothetical protein NC652_017366 [Populus alba x Populus x berolinensis]
MNLPLSTMSLHTLSMISPFLRGQHCHRSEVYQRVMGSFGETWLDFHL